MNSRVISYGKLWWRCPGLNGGPAAYESAALPTELHRHAVEFAGRSAGMIAEDRGRCPPNAYRKMFCR